MMKKLFSSVLVMTLLSTSCASEQYSKTVNKVELSRFLKKWFVIAGRFTFIEKGAHNAVEEYKFNDEKQRIDISFYFNKDSFDGPIKNVPQKGWVENKETNAHWKISPFWPLKFDYFIIAVADDYSWTAIGVPNKKYLWIMSDRWNISDDELNIMISKVQSVGYPVEDIVRIPQKW